MQPKVDPMVSTRKRDLKPVLLGIIIIISLVFAGAIGYVVYQQLSSSQPPSNGKGNGNGGNGNGDNGLSLDVAEWKTYENKEYGFRFKHPGLDMSCCSILGPASSSARNILVLSDESTIEFPGTDQQFDGFSVYVDANLKELEFEVYINEDIELQKRQYKLATGTEYITGGTLEVVNAGADDKYEGRKVAGYTTDTNERYYFPFPDDKAILAFSLSNDEKESFEKVFTLMLGTLEFTHAEVKACNNTQFEIISKIPEDWSCETTVQDVEGTTDLVQTTVKSDLYTIVISNPRRPQPPCISSGKDTQIGCFFNDFYIRPDFKLQMYQLSGENLGIYGFVKDAGKPGDVYMTIEHKDMKERSLTDEEKAPLFLFLDSVEL